MDNPNQTTQNTTQNINQTAQQSGQMSQFLARNPYENSQGWLNSVLGYGANLGGYQPTGAESGAFNQIVGMGQAGNPYASQIGNVASTLFGGGTDRTGMVNDAYSQYLSQLAPTAGGQFLDPSTNPFFSQTANQITDQVRDRVNAQYAGAGRDPAGAGSYGGTLARETANALSPMYANMYNTERGRQLDAISGMFGAGGSTAGLLSGLDQSRLGNMQAGIGAAGAATDAQMWGPQAVLQAEAARRGIPLETLAAQMGIVLPAAQAFGTAATAGTQSGTTNTTGTQTGTNLTEGPNPWLMPGTYFKPIGVDFKFGGGR